MRILQILMSSAIILIATVAVASWVTDGVTVCMHEENDFSPCIASDGTGGAIIAWSCLRPHPDPTGVFANRVNGQGLTVWLGCGTQVDEPTWNSTDPVDIVADGTGGAVICWSGNTDGPLVSIRAERVNAAGGNAWSTGGVALCLENGLYYPAWPRLAADGTGGAVVVWKDERNGNHDLYARRIDGTGNPLWADNGVAICTEAHDTAMHRIVTDGAGGAIIVWRDARNVTNDIYAQRIDAGGTVRWTNDGIPICSDSAPQDKPRIVSDGAGGAIVTWMDGDIKAQRVDADGTLLWGPGGVTVCGALSAQYDPQIASDDSSGAVLSWRDTRPGAAGIYTQRLSRSGEALWADQGVPVCLRNDTHEETYITGDGGGAAIVWQQRKTTYDYDIYGRVVGPGGMPQGVSGGTPICTDLTSPSSIDIASDMAGGAIVSWRDGRNVAESEGDIFAARIVAEGVSDVETLQPRIGALAQSYPNPFNPQTTIAFDLPERSSVGLRVFDVNGRLVRVLVDGAVYEDGHHEAVWNGRDDVGRQVASGTYFYRLDAGRFSETKRMVLIK